MSVERIPKMIQNARIGSGRRRGRPRKRWIDDLQSDLRSLGKETGRLEAEMMEDSCERDQYPFHWTVEPYMMIRGRIPMTCHIFYKALFRVLNK